MACERCGNCCLYTKITIPDTEDGIEGSKWVELHGCKVTRKNGDISVIVPAICDHLYFDPGKMHFVCGIYNERPKVCRDYLCNEAKKEANMKPTLEDREKTINKEVTALRKRLDELVKQRQLIDREISAIQTRGNQLDGQIAMLNDMKQSGKPAQGDSAAEKPVDKDSKKKK